jgi:hypothetical protein
MVERRKAVRGKIMEQFRKVWNEETNGFLITHKDLCGDYEKLHSLFIAQFPESRVSLQALKNQCSRLKICKVSRPYFSTRSRPLYSEQVKKSYVRIKIAQPNVWISKAKWVYMETHPWEDFTERSNYVFLDGNNRNFSPDNIERVPVRLMGLYNLFGGCEKGNPDVSRLRIAEAKLKLATLDAGEKLGLVRCYQSEGRKYPGRVFIEEHKEKNREYIKNNREKINERTKNYLRRMKVERPEKYAEILRKNRERSKARRKNEKA